MPIIHDDIMGSGKISFTPVLRTRWRSCSRTPPAFRATRADGSRLRPEDAVRDLFRGGLAAEVRRDARGRPKRHRTRVFV